MMKLASNRAKTGIQDLWTKIPVPQTQYNLLQAKQRYQSNKILTLTIFKGR
jgi:hypothetical protein